GAQEVIGHRGRGWLRAARRTGDDRVGETGVDLLPADLALLLKKVLRDQPVLEGVTEGVAGSMLAEQPRAPGVLDRVYELRRLLAERVREDASFELAAEQRSGAQRFDAARCQARQPALDHVLDAHGQARICPRRIRRHGARERFDEERAAAAA